MTRSLLKYLLPTYIKNAYQIIHFSKDPLGLLSSVEVIKNLMDKYGIKPHGESLDLKMNYHILLVVLFWKILNLLKNISIAKKNFYNLKTK